MSTTTNVGSCCCVQGPQCCCDGTDFYTLAEGEECTGSQFSQPGAAANISLVFEWCGMTATQQLQGGVNTYYQTETIDEFVCDTTGRYGPEASYTQANRKEISVYIYPEGGGGYCGYKRNFIVSGAFSGMGYRVFGGDSIPWENVIAAEIYDCTVYQCFDGSEAVVTMTLNSNTTDDTCGGDGAFDPCKFTAPELTVTGAP